MSSRRRIDSIRASRRFPSVQGWVLPHLIAWVESRGADSESIRRLLGTADLTDPDLRVPEPSVETAWRVAATLTHDEAIGVHVAEFMPRGALDLVEYAFRASATLAAGFERLARYSHLRSDRVAARSEMNGQGLLFLIRDTGSTALHAGRADFALAAALMFCAGGHRNRHHTVAGVFHAPRAARYVKAPPVFSRAAALSRRLELDALQCGGCRASDAGSREALASIVRRRLDKLLAERVQHRSGFAASVRHMMVEQLARTTLTPQTVARALEVSRRTLSRRLAEEGTSFRSLLDDVRREFACALLQDRTLRIRDVASFLQYSEPAAFNRSFRRWTGQTPRAFRDI